MNWIVFFIILVLTVVASLLEYKKNKDYKTVIILVIGVIVSILAGLLFPRQADKFVAYQDESFNNPTPTLYEQKPISYIDYKEVFVEEWNEIESAVENREYDKALDLFKKLAIVTTEKFGNESLQLGTIYAEIGELYNFLAKYVDAKTYVDYAKKIANLYKPDLNSYKYIASIYKSCGDAENDISESLFFYNKALSLLSEFNDTSSQLNATIYANLSNTYLQKNDHVNALDCADKARNLYELYLGTTTREAGIAYCSLGNIYSDRNHIKALEYFQKAEAIFKHNAPHDDSFLATCYSGLANLYASVDRMKCYEYAKAAFDLDKAIFGDLHEHTIKNEVNLAVYYRINSDINESKLLLEEALIKAREKYGDNNKMVAKIYIELGNVQDNLYESLASYDKAANIYKNLYGENNVDLAYVYANISVSYFIHNDLIKAKEYCNKAIQIFKEKSGSIVRELGYLYVLLGDMTDDDNFAIKKYEEAKNIYDKLYGTENINSARCNYKLASLYSTLGEKTIAEELFRSAIAIYELTYGEYSFENAELYHEYSKYLFMYNYGAKEAIKYSKKAVELSALSDQKNSFNRAQYCFVLGNLYSEDGNTTKSIEYLKECVRIIEYNNSIIPRYIEALSALAQQYSLMKDSNSARVYIDKAINAAKMAGEPQDLCAAYYHTAIALGNIKEYDKALEHIQIAESEGLKIYSADSKNIIAIKRYKEMLLEHRP